MVSVQYALPPMKLAPNLVNNVLQVNIISVHRCGFKQAMCLYMMFFMKCHSMCLWLNRKHHVYNEQFLNMFTLEQSCFTSHNNCKTLHLQ